MTSRLVPSPSTDVGAVLDESVVIDTTRRWLESFVIGLNLCPFAQRVYQSDRIRYVVSPAPDAESLRTQLASELDFLAATPIDVVETSLLIHPRTLGRFLDYCDFLAVAESLLKSRGFRGIIQIASFHPDYQFDNAGADDVGNFTNRSPYPMLHLLREESISRVARNPDELLDIPIRNQATLRTLGREAIHRLLHTIRRDPTDETSHAL